AGCPPILTVALPIATVPRLPGGVWKLVPGGVGMCAGELVAVEPTTAAGWPPIFTDETSAPSMGPENGCGSGVGTGPPGDGTITRCVSTAITVLAPLAAGWPIS